MLLPRVPYPLEKGDKLRAFHQLRILSRKHEIHLFCLNDRPLHPDAKLKLQPYCKNLYIHDLTKTGILWNLIRALFIGIPFQCGYFFSGTARRKIHEIINTLKPDHLYCQLARSAEYLMDLPYKKTIDYQDVFSKGLERRMNKAPFFLRWIFRWEYKRMLRYEKEIFEAFDNKTIIAASDRDFIPHPDRSKIRVVSNGVNFDYYQPQSFDPVYDLLFTGNMGYPPNIDGARYLAKEILPRIHKLRPETTLLIAGAHPHASVKSLQNEKVTIAGWVRDMRDCYSQSRVFIAPMRIGTGMQNKLLEAMSMEMPCITSPLANKALNAQDGVDILIGNSTEEYVKLILDILDHPEKARTLGINASRFVRVHFDWENCTAELDNIISSTL